MKNLYLYFVLVFISITSAQNLPIDFEGDVSTSDFVNFDGGTATVVSNPSMTGINNSASVGKIIRDGGAVFAGSKILLSNNLDFSVLTKITMKVYTTAPVGTIAKLKLEGAGPSVEIDDNTTVSGSWETLEWVFLGVPNNLNELVFMFDFGNVGDGSDTSTFYFDDIEQVAGPTAPVPTSLPITFENGIVDTDFLNFSGATASVIANPQINAENGSATVGQIIRDGGQFWAGSKILLNAPLDLSTEWVITMKIFTNAPTGTRVKLELEGVDGLTNLDYLTTVSGQWETASWNFYGKANTYDKIQLLFDFGNVGDGTANSTFIFDDIEQTTGSVIPDPVATTFPIDFESGFVNSDFTNLSGAFTDLIANPHQDADNPSATVGRFIRSGGAPWAQTKILLTDFMDLSTLSSISMKVYTTAPVGTLLKFKIESDGFANERDVNTTVSGAWETYTWDFAGDPPVYNTLTLMLGYATPNDASSNATFLFDDIEQVEPVLSVDDFNALGQNEIKSYPNPAREIVTISSKNNTIKNIQIFNILGEMVINLSPQVLEKSIDISGFSKGLYLAKVTTESKTSTLKIVVE